MSARTTKVHSAAIKVLRAVKTNTKYFSALFCNSPPPGLSPSKNVPILYFPLILPYMHVFIVFFCHCSHDAARCSQDGIIGENVCTAYFSQGLSLANYCLDGSQRFSPITRIFPVSRVDGGQGSLSAWCCLWQWYYQCPEKWHIVAHIINPGKWRARITLRGTPHVPLLLLTAPKKWIVGIARILKVPIICLTLPRISGQPLTSLCRGLTGKHVNSSCAEASPCDSFSSVLMRSRN